LKKKYGVCRSADEKGSRSESGTTAITVSCNTTAKAIEHLLEKAQDRKSVQSVRRPAGFLEMISRAMGKGLFQFYRVGISPFCCLHSNLSGNAGVFVEI